MAKVPTIVVPSHLDIDGPLDVVRAAVNAVISALQGSAEAEDSASPLSDMVAFIEEGNEEWALFMAAQMDAEPKDDPNPAIIGFASAAIAGREHRRGNTHGAWCEAAYAALMLGMYAGSVANGKVAEADVVSKLARAAADALHARNRVTKERAIAMYREGNFPSKDKAAEKIAPELHVAFRTARDWLKGA